MFEIIERIDRLTKENEQLKEEVEGWRKEFMF
jgi:FtsZ-binding cell division protein ZapB